MSQEQEVVPQTTEAVSQESAPVTNELTETEVPAAQETESAPVTTEEEAVPKHVKELIAQRKRRQDAEKEAAYWKGRAEATGATEVKPVVPQQPVVLTPPVLEKFDSFEEYEQAKDEYLISQAEQRFAKKMQAQQQQTHQQTLQQKFDATLAKEVEKDSTIIDAVTEVGSKISMELGMLIKQSDDGLGVVKYLHNNPKELQRISNMHPIFAAKELGVIEATLKTAAKPQPPKKVSAAPEPVVPINTNSAAAIVDEDNLPIDEWIKRRNKAAGMR